MEELGNLKYAELRKLAKSASIKANQKHEVLVAELTKYYERQELTKDVKQPMNPNLKNTGKSVISKAASSPVIKNAVTKEKTPSRNPQAGTPNHVQSRWVRKTFTPTSLKNNRPEAITNMPTSNKSSAKRKSTDSVSTPELLMKKRRSTFEKTTTPNLNSPEVVDTHSEKRRSSRGGSEKSPGVKEMLGAMKSDMNDREMKESLMSVIDKKVQGKCKTSETASTSSNIPRFAAFLKKRQDSKPITPGNKDWGKIHKKNFEKFDSLDIYLQKKRKRAEEITSSAKKAKMNYQELTSAMKKLKSHKAPEGLENKFKKPRLSNPNKTTPFKPSVFTSKNINFNFKAMKSPKTLPRKSPRTLLETERNENKTTTRKSTSAVVPRKSTATPFKFSGGNRLNTTVTSTKKVYNLKDSLSKPLGYKPHKGKLKPFENAAPTYLTSAAKPTQNRENIKKSIAQRRADRKANSMMSRRGINM